ncbi:MAG: hypothetical protein HY876_08145 [Coriobacteriales bacterium]|nr:hypothetical protein [Coriobacteriales bacterium]
MYQQSRISKEHLTMVDDYAYEAHQADVQARLDEFASLRHGFLDRVAEMDAVALEILLVEVDVPEPRRARARELLGELLGSSQLARLVSDVAKALPDGRAYRGLAEALRSVQAQRNRLAHDRHDFDGESDEIVSQGLAGQQTTTLGALAERLTRSRESLELLGRLLLEVTEARRDAPRL